jgi:hypothetical protein
MLRTLRGSVAHLVRADGDRRIGNRTGADTP